MKSKKERCPAQGKVCYESKDRAESMMDYFNLVSHTRKKSVKVYSCRYCDKWHMTSQGSCDE